MRSESRSQPTAAGGWHRRMPQKAKSHAVAAAQIHYGSRSQVFGGEKFEDTIESQLPADEPAIPLRASVEHRIHKADALAQRRMVRRFQTKKDRNSCDRGPCAAEYKAQGHAANYPDKKLLFTNMTAHGNQGGQSEGAEMSRDAEGIPVQPTQK